MTNSLLIVGCGYLGERVLRLAQERGWHVSATCRSASRRVNLEQLGAVVFQCEVSDPYDVAKLPAADVVVYAVSLKLRQGDNQHPAWLIGIRNFLDCWHRQPGRWHRFILISSTSVYGQKDEKWVSESDNCEPESLEGRTICLGEAVARQATCRNAEVVIARLSGLYGPGRVVYARQFREQSPLRSAPNGWLNLIHVEDAARAILALADTRSPDLVYNITDDEPVRRLDYWQALSQWMNIPIPPILPDHLSSPTNRRISNAKIKLHLGLDWHYPSYRSGVPEALREMSATATGL